MILLVDAGNTRIKWALTGAGEDWFARSGTLALAQVAQFAQQFNARDDISQVWVSNVAGEEITRHLANADFGRPVRRHFIEAQTIQCGVRNNYRDAAQLGCDRWAALIAAWHAIGRNCLVVSSGTATTIDALSLHGEFLGGLILPGVELMLRSLQGATAQLQALPGVYAEFPRNTADALFSGAIQASCGAIWRQYALLGDVTAPVLLSGGAAQILQPHLERLNLPLRIVDNLVLQGLLLIAQEAGT